MRTSSHNLPQEDIDNLVRTVVAEVRHKEVEVAGHPESQDWVDLASNQDRADFGKHRHAEQGKEGLAGNLREAGRQNPVDNLGEAVRFDNGPVRDPESGTRFEKQLAAERHSDIQSWESDAVYLVNLVVEKTSSRRLRGSRHCLPMLQDHGFESHSRGIPMSCRALQGLRASA